jgi:pectinesterase
VVFTKCDLQGLLVDPKGWAGCMQWPQKADIVDMYFGGDGAGVSGRVNSRSPGFHVITDVAEANNFTVKNFIKGDQWLPALGVDFTPGLPQRSHASYRPLVYFLLK